MAVTPRACWREKLRFRLRSAGWLYERRPMMVSYGTMLSNGQSSWGVILWSIVDSVGGWVGSGERWKSLGRSGGAVMALGTALLECFVAETVLRYSPGVIIAHHLVDRLIHVRGRLVFWLCGVYLFLEEPNEVVEVVLLLLRGDSSPTYSKYLVHVFSGFLHLSISSYACNFCLHGKYQLNTNPSLISRCIVFLCVVVFPVCCVRTDCRYCPLYSAVYLLFIYAVSCPRHGAVTVVPARKKRYIIDIFY